MELDSDSKRYLLDYLREMSSSALRCLGFAYKEDLPEFSTYNNGDEEHPAHKLLLDPSSYSSIESNLIFAGFVGLRVSGSQWVYLFIYFYYFVNVRKVSYLFILYRLN